MSRPLDPDQDFNILIARDRDSYGDFTARFGLMPNQVEQEVVNYDRDQLRFETRSIPDLLAWLNAHPDTAHTLYLQDCEGRAFMFSHILDHFIWSLPYGLLHEDTLLALLRSQNAICAWGSVNEPPPANMAEVAEARLRWHALQRYENGVLYGEVAG